MIGDKIATNADLMATDGVDDGKSTPVTAAVREALEALEAFVALEAFAALVAFVALEAYVALEVFEALEAYVALEAVEFDDCLCCYSCC